MNLITEIDQAKVKGIQSIKFFFNIDLDGKKVNKDFVIKKIENLDFDQKFLSEKINSIMVALKENYSSEECKSFYFDWAALIKENNNSFTKCWGCLADGPSKIFIGTHCKIPVDEKFFEVILQHMGREIKPQLNDQFEFNS